MSQLQEQDLRELIRVMLTEAMPRIRSQGEVRTVQITTNEELGRFVTEVVKLAQDPTTLTRLKGGTLKFQLASTTTQVESPNHLSQPEIHSVTTTEAPPEPMGVLHIDRGAVTERVITQAAKNNTRIVAASRVVITPLAKESARKHGVTIERAS